MSNATLPPPTSALFAGSRFAGYSIELTADGSPTLTATEPPHESMHNRAGAAGETIYIYGPVIEWAFANSPNPKFLNLGLGLGYVELLILILAKGRPFLVESLESNFELREPFKKFAQALEFPIAASTAPTQTANTDGTDAIYAAVFNSLKEQTRTTSQVQPLLPAQKWLEVSGDVFAWRAAQLNTDAKAKFNGVFFDPFSEKTSPEIWTEDFIRQFINDHCADTCAFATYAAKGKLNRALKEFGFELDRRPGFSGKRQSTFATRVPGRVSGSGA